VVEAVVGQEVSGVIGMEVEGGVVDIGAEVEMLVGVVVAMAILSPVEEAMVGWDAAAAGV